MGHLKARCGGRKQSRHREWTRIVAAGPSVDADTVGQIILTGLSVGRLRRIACAIILATYVWNPRLE